MFDSNDLCIHWHVHVSFCKCDEWPHPGRSGLERRMRDWQTQLRVPHREVRASASSERVCARGATWIVPA